MIPLENVETCESYSLWSLPHELIPNHQINGTQHWELNIHRLQSLPSQYITDYSHILKTYTC